jgi:hypothetical protein
MFLVRDRWGGYITTTVLAFTGGVTVYLIVSDIARRSEIRRRKAVLQILDVEEVAGVPPLEKAKERFGVLRIGGRFVNPFDEYCASGDGG